MTPRKRKDQFDNLPATEENPDTVAPSDLDIDPSGLDAAPPAPPATPDPPPGNDGTVTDPPPTEPDVEGAVDRLSQQIDGIGVVLTQDTWDRVLALLASVEETRDDHEDAKSRASSAKKAHEAAQEALERALARIRDGQTAATEPTLPFDAVPDVHQSDVVQAAHDDPAIVALAARLQTEAGWTDTDALVVAGYTEKERADLSAWLDGFAERPAIAGDRPDPNQAPQG